MDKYQELQTLIDKALEVGGDKEELNTWSQVWNLLDEEGQDKILKSIKDQIKKLTK